MTSKLSHIDEAGRAHMVDVGSKHATHRTAVAEGFVAMNAETLSLILSGTAPKGDVLAVARIARWRRADLVGLDQAGRATAERRAVQPA